jgi:hypothetical protein
MKKLLFITNLLVLSGFDGACQSHSKTSGKTSKNLGGTKSSQKSTDEGSSKPGSTVKDTTYKSIGPTAVIHGEPN